MTDPYVRPVPSHRDRQRALRGALARMTGDDGALAVLAAETEDPLDRDMTLVAALDALAAVVLRRAAEPERYLLGWIALEGQLADTAEESGDGDTDGV